MTTQRQRRPKGTGSLEVLPSGRYRGRWRALDGRSLSYTADTRREVTSHIQAALSDQSRHGYDQAPKSVTIASLCDAWWKVKHPAVKPRTAERYEDHLAIIKRELGDTPIASVDYEVVQAFVSGLPMAPKTVRACYGVLSLVLQHAARTGKLVKPVPKPDLPYVERAILTIPTRQQVEDLATASDARLWAPVLLTGYCGLREGELLALLHSDVHLDERWLMIRHARNKSSGRTESTKTNRIRRVYLPTRVVTTLTQHVAEYPGDHIVPVTASVLQKSWERARRSCGLETVRFHDLRHAAASMMIAAGLNVLQVSKQLGHANPTQTLDVYGHLFPEDVGTAITKMDEYLGHQSGS